MRRGSRARASASQTLLPPPRTPSADPPPSFPSPPPLRGALAGGSLRPRAPERSSSLRPERPSPPLLGGPRARPPDRGVPVPHCGDARAGTGAVLWRGAPLERDESPRCRGRRGDKFPIAAAISVPVDASFVPSNSHLLSPRPPPSSPASRPPLVPFAMAAKAPKTRQLLKHIESVVVSDQKVREKFTTDVKVRAGDRDAMRRPQPRPTSAPVARPRGDSPCPSVSARPRSPPPLDLRVSARTATARCASRSIR